MCKFLPKKVKNSITWHHLVTLILAPFQRKIDTNFSCLLIGGWLIPYRWFYLAATHKKLDKEVEQTDQANTKTGEIDRQGKLIGFELEILVKLDC